jgi:glucan biosynthesis protein C
MRWYALDANSCVIRIAYCRLRCSYHIKSGNGAPGRDVDGSSSDGGIFVVQQGQAASTGGRMHYLDALRVFMLLLGIPFHAFEIFKAGPDWLVSSPVGSPLFYIGSETIHSFRMFTFFMLSGLFSALTLARSPLPVWLKRRITRLGIPLIFATLILSPFELLAVATFKVGFSTDLPLTARVWAALVAQGGAFWLQHRWFLVVLIVHTLLLGGLYRVSNGSVKRQGPRPWRFLSSLNDTVLTLTVIFALAAYGIVAAAPFQAIPRNYVIEIIPLDRVILYIAPFFTGVLLGQSAALRDRFTRFNPVCLLGALLFCSIYVIFSTRIDFVGKLVFRACILPAGFCVSQALANIFKHTVKSASPLIQRLSEASFVIYLWHFVLVLAFGEMMIFFGISDLVACLLTIIFASAAAWLIFLAGEHSRLFGYIFNGQPLRSAT